MRTCSRMAEQERIIQIPNILLSVKDASIAISVSSKMVRLLIASGRLKAVNLGKRMTRISLQELTDFAHGIFPDFAVIYGIVVEQPDEPVACSFVSQTKVKARFYLPLPRHCDKGKQDGDDGFLVHVYFNLFVVGENLFEFLFQFFYAVRHGNDGAVAVDEE